VAKERNAVKIRDLSLVTKFHVNSKSLWVFSVIFAKQKPKTKLKTSFQKHHPIEKLSEAAEAWP
jgi:hypothetical protein